MDPINLTNITFIPGLEEIVAKVSFVSGLLQAIGGIFIFYIIMLILRWRSAKQQRKTLVEINEGIKKLNRKIERLKR